MTDTRNSAHETSYRPAGNDSENLYRSPYEAYPFLADEDADLRCDFEILTDRISSMAGVLASMCPERRDEIVRVDELVYHANPTLRTHMSITEDEIEWLCQRVRQLEQEAEPEDGPSEGRTRPKMVLPGGTTRAAYAHVIRVEGKQMVRTLYRARERGLDFPNTLIDFANLVSGYFHALSIWLNRHDGYEEIPFTSRNYPV